MIVPYLLSLFGLIFNTLYFPQFHIFAFAPFLALLVIRKPFLHTVWMAALAGLTLDLLSSNFRFGLYSVAFLLTAMGIYKLRNLFFEDKPHAMAAFSMVAALIFTLIELSFLKFFSHPPPFSMKSLASDLLLMPLTDGIFAFFWFCLPLKVYTWVKRGKLILLIKRCPWKKLKSS